MAAQQIFIHAWWRSGSTYLWSKLRENPSLICYYEPLHERIPASLAVFLVIWIASALQAISISDFVLDINRLSVDPDCQKITMEWFETIGCPIDYSDCASPTRNQSPIAPGEFERVLDDAAAAIRTTAASLVIADLDVVRNRLASLSPPTSTVLRVVF